MCVGLVILLKVLEFIENSLQKAICSKTTDLIGSVKKQEKPDGNFRLAFPLYKLVCKKRSGCAQVDVLFNLILGAMIIAICVADLSNLRVLASNRYDVAIAEMNKGEYAEAIKSFEELGNYRDSLAQIETAQKWIEYQDAQKLLAESQFEEAAEAFQKLDGFEDSEKLYQKAIYQHAIELYETGEYKGATLIFQTLDNYEDSELYVAQIALALHESRQHIVYEEACRLYNEKSYALALPEFKKLGDYLDSIDLAQDCEDRLNRQENAQTISAGIRYSVGVKADGTVIATNYNDEGQTNVSEWKDIVSVSAKGAITIGLKSDGTVAVSHSLFNIDITDWENIIEVSAGERYIIGLKNDGSLVSQGHRGDGQRNVDDWTDIVDVATGWRHTVGLDRDGKIWITGHGATSQLQQIERNQEQWTNIIAIAAGGGGNDVPGSGHTVGLRADGTVVAVGDNSCGQCNVSGEEWKNIVAIAAGDWHTVGLRADGSVVSTKPISAQFYLGACEVEDWEGIVAISAGCGTTIGVKSDGSTEAVGYNDYNQSNSVNNWKNIMVYATDNTEQ